MGRVLMVTGVNLLTEFSKLAQLREGLSFFQFSLEQRANVSINVITIGNNANACVGPTFTLIQALLHCLRARILAHLRKQSAVSRTTKTCL